MIELVGKVAGGLGLFLLGMMLMTDGLKLAAGRALRHILAQWTRTPLRGLLSGILITALVQASGAVTVASIGFVNAGLLDLLQTVYVIFGSNIGTTMTGWLVAVVGFQVDVQALALPLIALGMLLRLTGGPAGRGALGVALAGFGLFFLGIDVLKGTFADLGEEASLAAWRQPGLVGVLVFVGFGFVLTFLMQSSSAALAITLTAAAGGLVPVQDAAAVIIGANLGTTGTAALAVIGATPNAKRTAAAHVLFNLITAVVALGVLMPVFAWFVGDVDWTGREAGIATALALFHTAFNCVGVALLWPFTPRLVRFLKGRFRTAEEDLARPRYLDRNVVATPALAVDALGLELQRIGQLTTAMAKGALSTEGTTGARIEEDARVIARLTEAVRDYTVRTQRGDLPRELGEALPTAIRVGRYYEEMAELAGQVARMQPELEEVAEPELAERMARFRGECVALLHATDTARAGFSVADNERRLEELEGHYQQLKAHLLRAGSAQRLEVQQMVAQLDQYSAIRRLLEQATKGAGYLHGLLEVAARYRPAGREEGTPDVATP